MNAAILSRFRRHRGTGSQPQDRRGTFGTAASSDRPSVASICSGRLKPPRMRSMTHASVTPTTNDSRLATASSRVGCGAEGPSGGRAPDSNEASGS